MLPPPPAPSQSQARKVATKVAGGVVFLAAIAGIGSFVYDAFIKSSSPTEQVVNGCPSYRRPSTTDRLVICDNGPRVTELQEDLSFLGYDVNVDSDFGKHTQTAVNQFEQQHDLPVNGQVNAETIEAIRTAVRDRGGQPTIP